MRHGIAAAAVVLACVMGVAPAFAQIPDFKDKPVFFEMFEETYAEPENLALLRKDQIDLSQIGVASIEGFDWVNYDEADDKWWHGIEDFVYLLPIIASERESDQEWRERWFTEWYEVHVFNNNPNSGAWHPTVAAKRAMVLVYWLKVEEAREADARMLQYMREILQRHQRFLLRKENFSPYGNEGMWQSLALFESTRVFQNIDITQTALDRFITLLKSVVSRVGIEKQHAPAYHFETLEWLGQHADYLASLSLDWGAGVRDLEGIEQSMRNAGYFLVDHRFRLPIVGDMTASRLKGDERSMVAAQSSDVLNDPDAGFAIFKDARSAEQKRYVLFCIQNEQYRPLFSQRYHNDMMSVYYSDDGEIILGDGGAFEDSRPQVRAYLASIAAHNTVFPRSLTVPETPSIYMAAEVWATDETDSVTFGAALVDKVVQREVNMSRTSGRVTVRDQLNQPDTFLMLWRLGPDITRYEPGKRIATPESRTYEWSLWTRRKRRFKVTVRVDGRNNALDEEAVVVEGEEEPYLGWYSPDGERFLPSPTIKLTLGPPSAEEPIYVTTSVERTDK